MKSKKYIFIVLLFSSVFMSLAVFASYYETIGEASTNMIDVAFGVKMIVRAMFIIAGFAFFMGGLYKYRQYRQNSAEHRISTAIVLALLGIALVVVSFLPMITFNV